MSLIKADLIDQVALAADLTRVRAEMATEAVIESFKEALLKSQRIEIRGFGVFIVRPRKRGIGRNPRTGQEVPIPPGRSIRFKPGKEIESAEVLIAATERAKAIIATPTPVPTASEMPTPASETPAATPGAPTETVNE
ncbi:MAG: integration host factor subunit beta [Vicinamibacteria bacterium]|nr:integration host factor subunit beta [Vicinamibacteria bacterium]